ncbi:hypothetical protein Nm8I071_67280 [Nonomuraea sp. TT08I-71]|nr:hypothetical protein Nm8I071_67280 [Nonomuraea sp. TT08I-71]
METNDLDADRARPRAAGDTVDGPHDLPRGRDATFLVTRESGG